MFPPFENEPLVNFTEERPRRKMQEALTQVASELGGSYPILIGSEQIEMKEKRASRNPANLNQIIGEVSEGNSDLVNNAVWEAGQAFPAWSKTPPEVRARYLIKAAAILRRRRYEFAALMVYEASKSWNEAYADVAEAIDFLEFYAREGIRWGQPHPTSFSAGEENEVRYIPMGVGAIITPWNFPLAIMVGMTTSAIVAGNTVVLKPAEQTPIVAARFAELLFSTSLPSGVVNVVYGDGEVVGEALTGHPEVRFVSFTGSKDVGLHIYQKVSITPPGQKFLKRAVLEMGGKDAILVDDGVNLDGVAAEAIASAFGFQGQKCSACSRLIVHTAVYDALLERLVERAGKLTVGDPSNSTNYMGAVIDEDAFKKIHSYIEIGKSEGRLIAGGDEPIEGLEAGYFIRPTIFADVAPDARIAQEEIFGPVLAVIRADSFQHGLDIANSTAYGLTGSVFSYNREHLEQARQEFMVGNLYINRKCTGALVDVQPFGGFNLSGTDSKAGGREYLGHFLLAKAVTERW